MRKSTSRKRSSSRNKWASLREHERAPIAFHTIREEWLPGRAHSRSVQTSQNPADMSRLHRVAGTYSDVRRKRAGIHINRVCTFGFASSSWYMSKVASAVAHVTEYLFGRLSASCHMLVADDFHWEAGGQEYRKALLVFFVFCEICAEQDCWWGSGFVGGLGSTRRVVSARREFKSIVFVGDLSCTR